VSRRRFFLATVVLAALVCAASATGAGRPRPLQAGDWRTWWGQATIKNGAYTLESQTPVWPGETHSALLTSTSSWGDHAFSFTTTTLEQLRIGSPPNPWEVAWAMFRFRDLENYYYFILKPNGYELGKKQGSDEQIFLVTGTSPQLALGKRNRIQIQAQGERIRVFVDGARIIDFTDPNPLRSGAVGLYEEDARVRFESVTVTQL
jgi:hypothetical protein